MAVAAVAPLVPTSPAGVLVEDLQRLRVTHVLVDGQPPAAVLAAAAQMGLPVIPLHPFDLTDSVSDPADPPLASQLALLLQTSGTTSRPKVVPLSHANLLASARSVASNRSQTCYLPYYRTEFAPIWRPHPAG
jgi:long-subunit acyl-CoA synthetase (AMP-forming)